jgi:hypothetical protein
MKGIYRNTCPVFPATGECNASSRTLGAVGRGMSRGRTALLWVWLSSSIALGACATSQVTLVRHEADEKIDILVDGKPFTVYRWGSALKKPVLFPVRAADGAVVTRGFPLEPRPGESHDHPHHIGLWFNYGDVDGVDYWNNGKGPTSNKLGRIVHQTITSARGGDGQAELAVTSTWVNQDGQPVIREQTRFVFGAAEGRRSIDRIARLEAVNAPVTFNDNKEGLVALRLASPLEAASKTNATGTGQYRSSEGKTGDAVWGTRGRWVMLNGKLDGRAVTLALLDHPNNPGFPTHWHARGYGLFAANPLGQKSFDETQPAVTFVVAKGAAAQFAYRLLILSREATPADVEAEYQLFIKDPK